MEFIKAVAVEAEHVIADDIKTFVVAMDNQAQDIYAVELQFNDGENSRVMLSVNHEQGKALPTPEQRLAAQYEPMAKLLIALMEHVPSVSDDTKQWVNKIMKFAGEKTF